MRSVGRGIAPVVGIPLLIGILVAIAAVASVMFLGLAETNEPTPDAVLELDSDDTGATYVLTHEGGDTIDGDKTELVGVADESALEGHRLEGGESVEVIPVEEDVELVWYDGDTSYVLYRFDADPIDASVDEECPWVDSNHNPGNQLDIDVVVACDIDISDDVHVKDGGAVVGDIDAGQVDMDNGTIYGDLSADDKVDMDDGSEVHGDVVSDTGEIQLDNGARINGSATALASRVFVQGTSEIKGDAVGETDVEVDGGTVGGAAVARTGQVILDNGATVEGSAYVENGNDAKLDCSGGSVDGVSCGAGPSVEDEADY